LDKKIQDSKFKVQNSAVLSLEFLKTPSKKPLQKKLINMKKYLSLIMLCAFAGAYAQNTPPYAASTTTWTIGTQTWSDAIHMPECNTSNFVESITNPQCRSYPYGGNTAYYYNWAYVTQHAATLCPAPWRVPTRNDFVALDSALGGTGQWHEESESWVNAKYIDQWGGAFGGYAHGRSMPTVGTLGYYWSATEGTSPYAYNLGFNSSGRIYPQDGTNRNYGLQLRCVN
jgi:uncharacterized protein (TIGR02145 family)